MKISELEKILARIKRLHGDVEVLHYDALAEDKDSESKGLDKNFGIEYHMKSKQVILTQWVDD